MSSTAAYYLLSTLGGYLVTSFLLLKYPTLLHQRKKQRFLSKHISHRGGAGENLENTMAAFQQQLRNQENLAYILVLLVIIQRHFRDYFSCYQVQSAVTIGTDMLELDCHITKDEQVVVSHDENLKRSTGVNVNISDLKYCELPPYLGKLDVTFQRACQCEGKDNRIPLLKEVFEAFPNTPINIDIKVNNSVLIKKVSELVKQYRREHITVWGNANYEIVGKCYKENSDIPILFSVQRVLLILGLFFTGLLPFVPIREQFFEIPMPSIILKLKEPHKMSKSQKFLIWLSDILLMRKALFDHLTARGIQVYIWVLNEEQEYKRAFDLGATGVMTDYPTKLKNFLHSFSA
ncbi:PREDICTED: glycerophosphodiester phosphodiesterase domain-containing protein 1 isoform X1 [Myotis brandtii]|uniref:glycerophosphodiester phosphodiesterase domain-containing protein 1 isoform X1 n=1 Tax=Myotis brandtii TaxID=109478 RepID=UPI0007043491|nr:PREDICTED: glycerophosphodiester phosphodiesterase domain-containing protein 1 isoform X1 [Myotis brandtii]